MLRKTSIRVLLSLLLTISNLFRVDATSAQTTAASNSDLASKLAEIEKAIEEKRKELNVPGVSVVIVKDHKVIYANGLGLRSVERNLPVTPDTLFAIGSCSKAFTAMAAVMSADEGKLSLEDSPKKLLPYFKLQDPEADAKITIRDLLHHSSGLGGTDLAWYSGVLNREEVVRVAGLAKPTAKFREKFQYQNVMYSAAGEAVAKAQRSTWEAVIARRFFRPLGMKSSNTSVKQTQRAVDFATGYDISTKTPKKLPMRDLTNIAPAGAINSNIRDMAQWVRLMLGQGVFEGKRLVSEKGFNELITKHISAGGAMSGYGLGWALADWHGHRVLSHGGGIDGFNSLVALMPDQKLGLALLTNVSSSGLPAYSMNVVWSKLVGAPEVASSGSPAEDLTKEVGSYTLGAMTIEVVLKEGKLVAVVPGQPEYQLINAGGRRYKLGDPAPSGFFMTFRPVKGNESETEMYLEQPHGNYALPKRKTASATEAKGEPPSQMKELVGRYERNNVSIEITVKDGKVVLVVPGQPPYSLVEKEKDNYGAAELPDSFRVVISRDAAGKVDALQLKQPQGDAEFKRVAEAAPSTAGISVDELMARSIAALGGEANLRKYTSTVITYEFDAENQGFTGEIVASMKAPSLAASTMKLVALGKTIGTIREYFDGVAGGTQTSFSEPVVYSDKQIDDARIAADFYGALNWKTLFKSVTVKGTSKIGDEEVYVIVKTPEKGGAVTDYVSTKSFLLLKREMSRTGPTGATQPVVETYSDYRSVEGMMVPFSSETTLPGLGKLVSRVKDVKLGVDIPESVFRAQARK